MTFSFRKGGMENHLQQQIPEFFRQMIRIFFVDGPHDLVGFFEHVRSQALVRLAPIPRTAVRGQQPVHQPDQFPDRIVSRTVVSQSAHLPLSEYLLETPERNLSGRIMSSSSCSIALSSHRSNA